MNSEKFDQFEDDFNEDIVHVLNERLEEYYKNPKAGKSLYIVIKAICKKHGIKFPSVSSSPKHKNTKSL